MIDFKFYRDDASGEDVVEVPFTGALLLDYPLLNKGSAFTEAERDELGLTGLLPPHVSSMDEQVIRNYRNYKRKSTDIGRYVFLASLQDRNETLFYRLLEEYITEMMPIIYTPVVGAACQNYSHIYRRPRGLFISYPHRDRIDKLLSNAPLGHCEVIVVTDGERVLGLGDLGVGGMGIPVGKLGLYTLCAGIHPATTLPIFLDAGTDNEALLSDPLYIGWRHNRIRGKEYDDFIEAFIQAITRRFPHVLLQWEDFSRENASRLLERYRNRLCTFNDDIQGTGAVALAGLLAAATVSGTKISEQRVVMYGAGSAASGIGNQIVAAMIAEGLSESEARKRLWLVDRFGLVHDRMAGLEGFQKQHARSGNESADWPVVNREQISLEETVRHVRPHVLIGTAAQAGAFTEPLVREMAADVERPVIFPLSNPTSKCEADPADLIAWTEGRALVATGSPFPDVFHAGRFVHIGQCNNAFIFPGVGLGVIAAGSRRVTDGTFVAAARALSEVSPVHADPASSLFPPLEQIRRVSRHVAIAVAREAQSAGLAEPLSDEETARRVDRKMWAPRYARYRA